MYIYIPNTYDYQDISSKFNNMEEYVNYQAIYKKNIENLLKKYIDFEKIDDIIEKKVKIPIVNDKEYNFYRKYSTLGSKYIYLRNNIHIENLTEEEIKKLRESDKLDDSFLNNTIPKVIFEQGDESLFGPTKIENLVKSKSLIFEFAYDQKKCESLEQYNDINIIIKNIFSEIENILSKRINIPCSLIIYPAIPDLYINSEKKTKNSR